MVWIGLSECRFYHQLSSSLKVELFNRRGEGWNLLIDTRNRTRLSREQSNLLILYDVRLSYKRSDSHWNLSFGQMNLYDTAGIAIENEGQMYVTDRSTCQIKVLSAQGDGRENLLTVKITGKTPLLSSIEYVLKKVLFSVRYLRQDWF